MRSAEGCFFQFVIVGAAWMMGARTKARGHLCRLFIYVGMIRNGRAVLFWGDGIIVVGDGISMPGVFRLLGHTGPGVTYLGRIYS